MASLTSYAQKKIGDAMVPKAAFPSITTMYMGLFLASPGETGSLAGEVSGGGYARQNATTAMGAFSSATGISTNTAAMTFPAPSATWGSIVYAAWIDALTGGNVWAYEALALPFLVDNGSAAPFFDIGAISFRIMGSDASFVANGVTGYGAKKIGDAMLNKAAFPSITTMYQGLFTSSPGIAGSLASEAVGASYARQPITASMNSFDATLGTDTNALAIVYPNPAEDWGTIAYTAWVDASSGGNMWTYDQLPASRSIKAGSVAPRFPAGTDKFSWA